MVSEQTPGFLAYHRQFQQLRRNSSIPSQLFKHPSPDSSTDSSTDSYSNKPTQGKEEVTPCLQSVS